MDDQYFTSSNLIDKISYKLSGSISVPQAAFMADSVLVTVAHGLSYTPMILGIYSDHSDFSEHYEIDQPPYGYVSLFASYGPTMECSVRADATNLYIRLRNFNSTRTFYYRLIGIIPPDITSAVALSQSQRDDTLLTSSANFLKVHQDSYHDATLAAFANQTLTFNHNLGYRPSVLCYMKRSVSDPYSPSYMYRCGSENVFGTDGVYSRITIDNSNIYFYISSDWASTIRCYVKVYLDD